MKKLGLGCMRLPFKDDESQVELDKVTEMVDVFMKEGFNYFDTAHGYHEGKSEDVVRECIVKRYPRESYILTDKLTRSYFEKEDEIRPLFYNQLEKTGVTYFDYYLMHSLTLETYEKFQRCNAFNIVKDLKDEGKIKHIGISFHDSPEVLEKILMEHPEIEVVQIQLNYLDYDDPSIASFENYKVCEKFDKAVIIMEPVKGGRLANLPKEAEEIFDSLGGGSYASYAIRYAASFKNVFMVLSGMSNMEQLKDNIGFMNEFVPFNEAEYEAVKKVRQIIRDKKEIECTSCRYCIDGCPMKIKIPDLFECYNENKQYGGTTGSFDYGMITENNGKASQCIECGKCEEICPQHLEIRKFLKEVSSLFE